MACLSRKVETKAADYLATPEAVVSPTVVITKLFWYQHQKR